MPQANTGKVFSGSMQGTRERSLGDSWARVFNYNHNHSARIGFFLAADSGFNRNPAINFRKTKPGIVPKTMTHKVFLGNTMPKAV
jgi:hypothetical protein